MTTPYLKSWKNNKLLAFLLSASLFTISLFTILYTVNPENVSFKGYEAFLLGWMDLSGSGITWLANPLSVIALLLFLFNKLKAAYIFGFIALALGFGFIFFGKDLGKNITVGISYFFWMASIFNICFAALYLINWRKKRVSNL